MRRPTGLRGQADSLLGILVLLFVFFILFLPPDIRQEILDEEYDNDSVSGPRFLDVTPGLLTPEGLDRLHAIPSFFLLESRTSTLLAEGAGFTVSKGWFVNEPHEFPFALERPDLTENAQLSFQAGRREGVLTIFLNGQQVYQGAVGQASPPPIPLPQSLLREQNSLRFQASGVGLAFWRQNDYDLADLRVIGDVTDRSRQAAQNTFTVNADELAAPDHIELAFRPSCVQAAVGTLRVELNGRELSRAIPICETRNRIELAPSDLRAGTNTVIFSSEKGTFEITGISVRITLGESKAYKETFRLTESEYDDIYDGRRRLRLILDFSDDDFRKRAEVRVNSIEYEFDTRADTWEKDISSAAREGTNTVEIRPLDDLSIDRLRVRRE